MRTRKRNLGYCGLIALLFGIGRIAQWKWTRKLRVRQAAATPHSKNWQQSIGWHKKEFIGQTWVTDQIESSSSKEKEENCKIGSSKRKRYSQRPKLVEDKTREAQSWFSPWMNLMTANQKAPAKTSSRIGERGVKREKMSYSIFF